MDKQTLFARLIEAYGDRAYNFAWRLAGNAQDAGDLVQEAFLRAFKRHDLYDPGRPFEAWFFQILHHIYLDTLKRAERRRRVSIDSPAPAEEGSWEEMLPSPETSALDGLVMKEQDQMVQRILDALPVHYRATITLCDIEGLSYEEIGRVMDCPVGTVRSRIHQGRKLVRQAYVRLQERGGVLHA